MHVCDGVRLKPEGTIVNYVSFLDFDESSTVAAKRERRFHMSGSSVWPNPLRHKGIFMASLQRFVAPGVRCLSSRDGLQIETLSKHMFKKEINLQKNISQKFLQGCRNSHR